MRLTYQQKHNLIVAAPIVAITLLIFGLIWGLMVAESRRSDRIDACVETARADYEVIINDTRDEAVRATLMQAREAAIGNCYSANPKPESSPVIITNTGGRY